MPEKESIESIREQRERERDEREKVRKEVIWEDRKRTIFGLPWSFTKYSFNGEKLVIETGFLSLHQEVVRLYRIMDVTLDRSLRERIFGLGTITVFSTDPTAREFKIQRIKCSVEVADALFEQAEQLKRDRRMLYGGNMALFPSGDGHGGGDDDGFGMFDNMDNMF